MLIRRRAGKEKTKLYLLFIDPIGNIIYLGLVNLLKLFDFVYMFVNLSRNYRMDAINTKFIMFKNPFIIVKM